MRMSENFTNKKPFSMLQVTNYFERVVIPKLKDTDYYVNYIKFEIKNDIEIAFDTDDLFHIRRAFSMPYYAPDHVLLKFKNLVKDFEDIMPFIDSCSPDFSNSVFISPKSKNSVLESVIMGHTKINDREVIFYVIFNIKEEFKTLFDGGKKVCQKE